VLYTEYTRRSSRRPIAATIAATGRLDDRLVYSLQAIGRRDYANEHQSQGDVWQEYIVLCYYAIDDVTLFTFKMESNDDNVNANL